MGSFGIINILAVILVQLSIIPNIVTAVILDDSEYKSLIQFNRMLDDFKSSLPRMSRIENSSDNVDCYAVSLSFTNMALFYQQRNIMYKQGGVAESLFYIEQAIQQVQQFTNRSDKCSGARMSAIDAKELQYAQWIHGALMLAELGQRHRAMNAFNHVLRDTVNATIVMSLQEDLLNISKIEYNIRINQQIKEDSDSRGAEHRHGEEYRRVYKLENDGINISSITHLSSRELSMVLYHKAEVLLTLYDDDAHSKTKAIELFQRAVQIYPCNYMSFLQLAQAMKTKHTNISEWLALIDQIEEYLTHIQYAYSNPPNRHRFAPPAVHYVPVVAPTSADSEMSASERSNSSYKYMTNFIKSVSTYLYSSQFYSPNVRTHIHRVSVCNFSTSPLEPLARVSSLHTITTPAAIRAALNWALFICADAVTTAIERNSSEAIETVLPVASYHKEEEEDTAGGSTDTDIDRRVVMFMDNGRSAAWKYLQQARHFDRVRLNEQYMRQQPHQQPYHHQHSQQPRRHQTETGTASSSSRAHSTIRMTAEDLADLKSREHHADQVEHLKSHFIDGFWDQRNSPSEGTSKQSNTKRKNQKRKSKKSEGLNSRKSGSKSRIPIFIVGFFRSGSTLLETLLEKHSVRRKSQDGDDRGPNNNNHGGSCSMSGNCISASRDDTEKRSNGVSTPNSGGMVSSTGNCTCSTIETGSGESVAPAIWGMGEDSPFVFEMYALQEEALALYDQLSADTATTMKSSSTASSPSSSSSSSSSSLPDTAAQRRQQYELNARFMRQYEQLTSKRAKEVVSKMLRRYREFHPDESQNQNRTGDSTTKESLPVHIVDKMLSNYLNIGLIHLLFPRAIILHTVRDPLDTLFSGLSNRFGDPSAAYSLHMESLVKRYVDYLEVMQHFRTVLPTLSLSGQHSRSANHHDQDGEQARLNGTDGTFEFTYQALVDVRYEELVANPERVLRRIMALLDVEYHDGSGSGKLSSNHLVHNESTDNDSEEQVVDPSSASLGASNSYQSPANVRVVQTASRMQVKAPINTKAVGKWRKYSAQLQHSLIPMLKSHLPRLVALDALPFLDPTNKPCLLAMLNEKASGAKAFGTGNDAKQEDDTCSANGNDGDGNNIQPTCGKCTTVAKGHMNWLLDHNFNYTQLIESLR